MNFSLDKNQRLTIFNKPDISYLKDRLEPEDILTQLGIEIASRTGDEISCFCPHPYNHSNGDTNPSFGYNVEKMKYNCFVCGGGDLLDLVCMVFQLNDDWETAELWLRGHALITPTINLVDKLTKLMHPADEDVELPEYDPASLFQYRKIHPYLYERGLSKEVIISHQIGYDERHEGIVIPHFFMGKLVGIQNRHLYQMEDGSYYCPRCSDSDKKVPKYKNSSGFPKKNTLYNYDQAMAAYREKPEKMIVVESPMTVLRLLSLGYRTVVATFGPFSFEQMISLTPCQTGIILWPDNDPAGYENITRVAAWTNRRVPVQIAPLVGERGHKGDAADLSKEDVSLYLSHSYGCIELSRNGLLTIEELRN